MTPFLYVICGALALLLFLLLWALRRSSGTRGKTGLSEEQPRTNIQYFPQIQQSLSPADREFLMEKGGPELTRRVFRERREITRDFLKALDEEFSRLLRLARIIAALSPEVVPMQEFERVRLSVVFRLRLQAIHLRLALGSDADAATKRGERYREPPERAHGNGDEGARGASRVGGGNGVSGRPERRASRLSDQQSRWPRPLLPASEPARAIRCGKMRRAAADCARESCRRVR